MKGDDDIAPTLERRAHDMVERSAQQVADVDGAVGDPWQAQSRLGKLEARGSITAPQRQAGEHFARLFALAALDPIQAADMGRISGAGSRMIHRGSIRARRQVNEALDALGGLSAPLGSCAWFVLGCDHSVQQWAQREGWNGRPINKQVATGILISALSILAKHFGY